MVWLGLIGSLGRGAAVIVFIGGSFHCGGGDGSGAVGAFSSRDSGGRGRGRSARHTVGVLGHGAVRRVCLGANQQLDNVIETHVVVKQRLAIFQLVKKKNTQKEVTEIQRELTVTVGPAQSKLKSKWWKTQASTANYQSKRQHRSYWKHPSFASQYFCSLEKRVPSNKRCWALSRFPHSHAMK